MEAEIIPVRRPLRRWIPLLWASALALGCAAPQGPGGYRYFDPPDGMDPWSHAITRWQLRERDAAAARREPARALPADPAPGPEPGPLREQYAAFVAERRRALAARVASWVQEEARTRYTDDGSMDVWPGFDEVLAASGEDCDGLELLAYHALRELGFPRQELFRAILRSERREAHHMVTLWFETPEDPWVIDPTGAVTGPVRRMSRIRGWAPVKVFSETAEYSVRGGPDARSTTAPAAPR